MRGYSLYWIAGFHSSVFRDITPCGSLTVKQSSAYCLSYVGFLFGILLDPEDRDSVFLRNVSSFSPGYTALYPTVHMTYNFCRLRGSNFAEISIYLA
jgi:hypothetical protein